MTHRISIRLICSLVAVSIGSATVLAAQQQAALRFASASVEPSAMPQEFTLGGGELIPFFRDIRISPGDRFEANTSLRRLIEYAYGFDGHWDRARGTEPLLDQLFYVSAQGEAGSFDAPTADDLSAARQMLQQLLADRFKLTVTTGEETRQAMVIRRASPGRFGPKLQRVPGGCVEGSQADADARALARCAWNEQGSKFKVVVKDFDQVTAWISRRGRLDVVNETGLVGAFAFETAFDPYTINRTPSAATVDASRLEPALVRVLNSQPHYPYEPTFEAAMKNDLDLVISYEPRPMRVLSIAHVEPLREN